MNTETKSETTELTQSQTVLRRLRDLIIGGAFPPETKLKAAVLAEQLNTSRTPISNALAVLESEGLVAYSSRRGYTTIDFTIQDFLDALEVRANLTALAVEIVVRRGVGRNLQEILREKVEASRKIVDVGQWTQKASQDWFEHIYDFHRAIIKSAGNRYLESAITRTLLSPVKDVGIDIAIFGQGHDNSVSENLPILEQVHQSQLDHERVLALIESGQAERARNIMYELVMTAHDRVSSLVKEQNE